MSGSHWQHVNAHRHGGNTRLGRPPQVLKRVESKHWLPHKTGHWMYSQTSVSITATGLHTHTHRNRAAVQVGQQWCHLHPATDPWSGFKGSVHAYSYPIFKRVDAELWKGKNCWGKCSDVGANLLLTAAQEADSLSCQIRPGCIKNRRGGGFQSD